ncbi:uncharacterized protein LOC118076117 isoform X2 [Zootoca vivipara]|uniref:uncharacterized protein LOC118076117 isoform X2 n=1 Tax=Zootoca vivipara TaxID=8524 RepID=UPI00293B91C5|nr:uncharacterized protein LOC118076117 isoform X2 [Zootoca vivipara]
MEFCWLRILIGLFVLRKENAFVPERIVRASGEQATLPCESVSPRTRWFWLPLSSRCAEVQRGYVEITWSLTGNEVAPIRFKERLANQTSGSLALRNLVMSDSGTYVCRLPNGLETRTVLEVTAGCHNNVFVSFWWLNASSLRLSCRHCRSPGNFKPNSFRWMLNSKPLGNEHWFEKSNFGSFVQLLSTRRRAWGRWECHSLANHTWVSEICLEPPVREKGAGREPPEAPQSWTSVSGLNDGGEDAPSGSASAEQPPYLVSFLSPSPATAKTTDAAPAEAGGVKGTKIWIWALLLLGLALVLAAFGTAVWMWRRQPATRKQRGRKERAGCASVINPARVNEELYKRKSLEEGPASLHYAQLEYPRRKSASACTQDSSTVYAVIV